MSQFQDIEVKSFGGGVNFAAHPAYIRDDQWAFSENFIAIDGAAETARAFTSIVADVDAARTTPKIIGFLQYPFNPDAIIIAIAEKSTSPDELRLYRDSASSPGSPTEFGPVGARAKGIDLATLQWGILNGFVVVSGGRVEGTDNGVARFNGVLPANYTTIVPAAGNLSAEFLTSFGGHIVAAAANRNDLGAQIEGRRVAWSDSNDPDVWAPSLANSADDVILDDFDSVITGLERIGANQLGVFTRRNIYVFVPTQRIPAFSRQTAIPNVGADALDMRTIPDRHNSVIGSTPKGVAFMSLGTLQLLTPGAGLRDIGQVVQDYYFELLSTNSGIVAHRPVVWHPQHRQICFGVPNRPQALWYEPTSGAWSIMNYDTLGAEASINNFAQVVISGQNNSRHEMWLGSSRSVYREDLPTVAPPANVCFVDTKDFHRGHDILDFDSVLVDWEPLTNSGTDAIEVLAATRDAFSPSLLGSAGREIDTLTFTSLGTLTAGASELPFRTSARYTRLRFRNSSGRARIRGFTLKVQRGGDRA